jgi:TRAP-type transport system periplasmic protein
LSAEQRAALQQAADAAEVYFREEAKHQDLEAERIFAEAGVEVVHMTKAQADAWRAIAAESSYRVFADEVPGGRELLDSALAVD